MISQNRMAAAVMEKHGIARNDFYSLLSDKLGLARGDPFHWTPPAYQILAQACEAAVTGSLGKPR